MNSETRTSMSSSEDGEVLQRVLSEGVDAFASSLRPFLISLGDQLFDLSTGRGLSGSKRQAHYDALNTLKRGSERFHKRYESRLRSDLESLNKERLTPNPFIEDRDAKTLGLIELEEMDRNLALEKVTKSLVDQHRVALECLTIRTAILAGIQPLKAKTPFHPAYLLKAYTAALDEVTEDAGVFIDAVDFFRDRYLNNLGRVYERLNSELVEAGVEPRLEEEIELHGSRLAPAEKRPVKTRAPERETDPAAEDSGEEKPSGERAVSERTATDEEDRKAPGASKRDLDEMYANVMRALETTKSIAEGMQESAAASVQADGSREVVSSGPAPKTTASSSPSVIGAAEVLSALNNLRDKDGIASDSALEALVRQSIGAEGATLDPDSAKRLGFVDNVFNTLESSFDVSNSLAPAVERLRVPLAHLSVKEPRFFAEPDHPAHSVIDRLSTLAGAEQQISPGLQKRIGKIVERLNQTFDTDDAAFANAKEDLDNLAAQRSGAAEKNIERLIAGLEGQERLSLAQRQVGSLLWNRMGARETPQTIIGLMDQGWREAMVQVALREGVGSLAWREEAALLEDIQELFDRRKQGAIGPEDLKELKPRLDALSQRISASSPGSRDHEEAIGELFDVLAGNEPLATTNYQQPAVPSPDSIAVRIERLPKLRRWLSRVQDLQVGTRMRYRDKSGAKRRMKLVWISNERDQFAFANEAGQKVAELSAVQLARQLSRGVRPTSDVDQMNVINRSVYNTLEDAQKALSEKRTHDAVTRLINGPTLMSQVRRSLRHAQSHDSEHAFLLIDIDNFSLVNEVFDETSGDQILKEFAEFLARLNDSRTLSARIGDDDFGLLLTHRSLDEAREIADKLRSDIALQSFAVGEDKISFTISVGLVPVLQSSSSDEAIMEQARGALEIAKSQGRNQVAIYDPDQQERRQYQIDRDETQRRLEEAIATDALALRAQPIVQSAVGGGEGPSHHYEVLLALRDSDGKLTSPQDFIVTAERFGFASQVDRWVVTEAFAWISELVDKQKYVPQLSINLSGASITSDEFLDFVLEQISEHGVGTNRLCFEITETGSIENLHKAADFVRTLKNIGCKFSLDDFGTGLASHTYLKELPVDYVKIDGSFISDVNENRTDFAMAKSITDLAHFLGQKTIAECVEDMDLIPALREIGVDYLQGWGIGMPRLLHEIVDELPDLET